MEPPSPNTSWASDSEEPDWWGAATFSDYPESDKGAAWNAAIGPHIEENALQGWPEQFQPSVTDCYSEEETCGKTIPPSGCSFLKKLWKIVCSHRFQSIWWGDDGNCIIISEKLFRKEVLGRKGKDKIFKAKSMTDFLLQLNDHGFSKMEGDSPLCLTIEELQAVVAAGPTLGKLLFYYSPFFKRYYPNLLSMCIHDTGERNRQMAASPPGLKVKEERSRKRRLDAQEAAAGVENTTTQTAAFTSSTPSKPQAATTAQMGSAGPPPRKQHCSHSPASMQGAPPMPFTASPHNLTPPTPNIFFTPAMGCPNLPSGQPSAGAMQAHGAGLPPLSALSWAMAMLASASATLMAELPHGQAPTHRHCPTCVCRTSTIFGSSGDRP